MPNKKALILLTLATAAVIAFNYIWLVRNQQPIGSDMALHARYANELLRDVHILKGPVAAIGKMWLAGPSNYYPPFFYDVSMPYQILFGVNTISIAMTNSFFIVIFMISMFFVGRKVLEDDNLALLAACITFAFPLFNDSSREVMIDFALAAMTTAAFALLLYNDELQDRRMSVYLGIIAGLGILTKWFLPTFIFLPSLYVFIRGLRKDRKKTLKNAGLAVFIAICIAFPWFRYSGLLNTSTLQSNNFTGGAPTLNLIIMKANLSIPVFFTYLSGLYNIGTILWVLFIIALIFSFHRKAAGRYVPVFLLYAGSLIFWYLMIKTKEPRYNLTHLTAVSLILMSPFLVWKNKWLKYLYGGLLCAFSILLYSILTFGFPVLGSASTNKLMGYSVPMMNKWASRKGIPERKYWPSEDIFRTLKADWAATRGTLTRNPVLVYTTSDVTGLDQFAYQFFSDCQYHVILCDDPKLCDYFLHYGLDPAAFDSTLKAKIKLGFDFPVVVKEFPGPPLEAPYDKAKLVLYKRKTPLIK